MVHNFFFQTEMVSSALECIIDNLHRIHDSYTTCLITYALALADHPKAEFMVQRLKNKAVSSKGKVIVYVKPIFVLAGRPKLLHF